MPGGGARWRASRRYGLEQSSASTATAAATSADRQRVAISRFQASPSIRHEKLAFDDLPSRACRCLSTHYASAAHDPEGVASEWDVKARMAAMADDVGRVEDLSGAGAAERMGRERRSRRLSAAAESSKTSMQLLIGGDGESRQGAGKIVGGSGRVVSDGQHGFVSAVASKRACGNIKARRWRMILPDLWRTIRGIGTCCGSTASTWPPRVKTI